MGLVRRPTAPPETRDITSLPWGDEFRSTAGETVTRDTALMLPAVWRAVELIADTLSSIPVEIVRINAAGDKTRLDTTAQIVNSPSLRLTVREWIYTYCVSLALDGNAYGVILAEGPTGLAQTIEWVDPRSVHVDDHNQLAPATYYIDGKSVPVDRIVHIRKFLVPGSAVGLSPLEYHKETFGVAQAARKYGSRYFGDGAHPTAVLSTEMKLTKDQADMMKKGFVASLRGKREPAVLGSGIKYERIQDNPSSAGLDAVLMRAVTDIARVFGIPVELLFGGPDGNSSSQTYANRTQLVQNLVDMCLIQYAGRLEEMWSRHLPRGQFVRFNFDALLRGDVESRYAAHSVGLASGFITVAEVRDIENLPVAAEQEPEVEAALNLVSRAPSLVQNPGLPALVDQLRILAGKEPLNPVTAPAPTGDNSAPQ